MPRAERTEASGSIAYPAEKARQGRIAFKTPTRRAIFIAGLAGLAVLALVAALL